MEKINLWNKKVRLVISDRDYHHVNFSNAHPSGIAVTEKIDAEYEATLSLQIVVFRGDDGTLGCAITGKLEIPKMGKEIEIVGSLMDDKRDGWGRPYLNEWLRSLQNSVIELRVEEKSLKKFLMGLCR